MTDPSLSKDEITNRTSYHAPSLSGASRHQELSAAFWKVIRAVDQVVPEGREKSIAITNLEQAKMWASAGVARNPETR